MTDRKIPESYAVFDAVIPKGANYYVNEHGEYVSDKLIVKDITKDPIKIIKL